MKGKLPRLLMLALFVAGAVLPLAQAQLGTQPQAELMVGPPRPDDFPRWVQDINGLKLQLCLATRNPNAPEAGPCEFEGSPRNIIEAAYWAATAEVEDPEFGRVILIMAVEAANDPAEGGKVLVNEMRFRIEPAVEMDPDAQTPTGGLPVGEYTVETPLGPFSFSVPLFVDPPDDAAAPEPEQTINVNRVDIIVERDPTTGRLFVPDEPRAPLIIPPGGFMEGTPLPGPITDFLRAEQAPPGFVGDIAEVGEEVAPAGRQRRALLGRRGGARVGRPRFSQIPAPTVGAPQPLLNGGVFRVILPPDNTARSRTLETNLFTVQGQIFEDPAAAADNTGTNPGTAGAP